MSPRRRVLMSALSTGVIFMTALAAPAFAQFYDAARRSLDFSMDGIERSPRLLGMGRLAYVGNDPHTAITLWDFAANPTGIYGADSANTVELYPATASSSDLRDYAVGQDVLERQVGAARENRMGYEIWRRTPGRSAYGIAGTVGHLRMDQVYSDDVERRSALNQPTVMPVLMGRVPFVKSPSWVYSARLYYSGEGTADQYRGLVQNSKGQYLTLDGPQLDPPEFFTPTDYKVSTMGGGLGVSYQRPAFKAAINADLSQNSIKGTSEEKRHSASTNEKRPYATQQATLVGRLGRSLEWGIDGHRWRSSSEQSWLFSVSAGVGANPLVGRGKLLEREELGQSLAARLRWTHGPLELGGGLSTGYRRVTVTPPSLGDLTSFNRFRNVVYYYSNADSLVLPDSVSYNRAEERSWEFGGGFALQLPWRGGLWGAEFHQRRYTLDQTLSGEGPKRTGWDVRTGLEHPFTSVVSGSVGYVYRFDDRDELTQQNEFVGHSLTLGLGLRPAGASWSLNAGYAIEWLAADYGDPAKPRGSVQQLASELRWAF